MHKKNWDQDAEPLKSMTWSAGSLPKAPSVLGRILQSGEQPASGEAAYLCLERLTDSWALAAVEKRCHPS